MRVIGSDSIVAATVNGVPARIRIIPGANALPLINADVAERARLKGGLFEAAFKIRPEVIYGPTNVARIDLG